jgi:cob(I)alamin adenosyltransferase
VITKWIDHQQRSFFNPWERQMETGLILVFTGDEVYYSNPAIGQVLRAIGRNMNVCIIDFVAGDRNDWIGSCSEKVRDMVEVHHFNNGLGPEEKNPRRQWEKARELINSGKFRIVIIEGISSMIAQGIVDPAEIVHCFAARPKSMHVIIADKNVNGDILNIADHITEVADAKLPDNSSH